MRAMIGDIGLSFWRLLPANPIVIRVVGGGSKRIQHLWVRVAYLLILLFVMMMIQLSQAIRAALERASVRGATTGALVDHVELSGPPRREDADSRNFVLCPSGEFDRSPCGTGTSAKMASLHAHGELAIGAKWRQEGITGGLFVGSLARRGGELIPSIEGRVFITGEAQLHFAAGDPFRAGFHPRR